MSAPPPSASPLRLAARLPYQIDAQAQRAMGMCAFAAGALALALPWPHVGLWLLGVIVGARVSADLHIWAAPAGAVPKITPARHGSAPWAVTPLGVCGSVAVLAMAGVWAIVDDVAFAVHLTGFAIGPYGAQWLPLWSGVRDGDGFGQP